MLFDILVGNSSIFSHLSPISQHMRLEKVHKRHFLWKWLSGVQLLGLISSIRLRNANVRNKSTWTQNVPAVQHTVLSPDTTVCPRLGKWFTPLWICFPFINIRKQLPASPWHKLESFSKKHVFSEFSNPQQSNKKSSGWKVPVLLERMKVSTCFSSKRCIFEWQKRPQIFGVGIKHNTSRIKRKHVTKHYLNVSFSPTLQPVSKLHWN